MLNLLSSSALGETIGGLLFFGGPVWIALARRHRYIFPIVAVCLFSWIDPLYRPAGGDYVHWWRLLATLVALAAACWPHVPQWRRRVRCPVCHATHGYVRDADFGKCLTCGERVSLHPAPPAVAAFPVVPDVAAGLRTGRPIRPVSFDAPLDDVTGYQPRGDVDVTKLRPPTGGSAVEPPPRPVSNLTSQISDSRPPRRLPPAVRDS